MRLKKSLNVFKNMKAKKAAKIVSSYNYVFESGDQAYYGLIDSNNEVKVVKVNVLQRTPSKKGGYDRYLIGVNGRVVKARFLRLFPDEKTAKNYMKAVKYIKENGEE